jgi:hypothetical protein
MNGSSSVGNFFPFFVGPCEHDSLKEMESSELDQQLQRVSESYDQLIGRPKESHQEDQLRLKKFLQAVCLENSPDALKGGSNLLIAATMLKMFVGALDFSSILASPKDCKGTKQYHLILSLLQKELERSMIDYLIVQMAFTIVKKAPHDPRAGEWLKEKYQSMIDRRVDAGESFLVSLGWKLPPPHIGHEMVGFFNPKKEGGWKLHIVGSSAPLKTNSHIVPCSIRISYPISQDFTEKLLSLTPLQSSNQSTIAFLSSKGVSQEQLNPTFQSIVHRIIKGTSSEKHSFHADRPLSHFVHAENRGCAFGYFKPLMCVVAKTSIKKLEFKLSSEQEQNVKTLTEVLYLAYKFYCLNMLNNLFSDQEGRELFSSLLREEEKLCESHQGDPFMHQIVFPWQKI